jgi:ribosomal protein S18 acetylase RimI-like enzyme
MRRASAVRIRKATRTDVDEVASIWQAGWIDGHAGHVPAELESERRAGSWPARVVERLDDTWVACTATDTVGFVTVVHDELEQVYVTAGARGSGAAAALLRHGEDVVGARGFECAWLAVASGNRRARRFYEREGWRDTGPLTYQARTGNGVTPVPVHRYERTLVDEARRAAVACVVDGLPPWIVERFRQICSPLAGVVEEPAWTGLRWKAANCTFAHVVWISDGWPPAYAKAAASTGPLCVLTVRCERSTVLGLAGSGGVYFAPAWGTNWTPSVLGIRLDDHTDWDDVDDHITRSHELCRST